MVRKIADLEDYVNRAGWSKLGGIFDQDETNYRPQLDSDRVNRVLLYPGSFNPPHAGHQALLNHVLENCHDINVIAAFILPLDENRVQDKCDRLGQSLVLTKVERAHLWQGYTPSPWYTVYSRSELEWHWFRKDLEKVTARDGFRLRFVLLYGPDLIRVNEDRRWHRAWDCDEIVTSNVARAADFTTPGRHLVSLEGCHGWERLRWNDAELARHAEKMVAINNRRTVLKLTRRRILKLYSESVKMLRRMRVCRQVGSRRKVIRFIPTTAKHGKLSNVSSTLIRRIINDCAPRQLQTKLASIVLHPRLLVRVLQRRQQLRKRWDQELEAGKKKNKNKNKRK